MNVSACGVPQCKIHLFMFLWQNQCFGSEDAEPREFCFAMKLESTQVDTQLP